VAAERARLGWVGERGAKNTPTAESEWSLFSTLIQWRARSGRGACAGGFEKVSTTTRVGFLCCSLRNVPTLRYGWDSPQGFRER